MVAAGNFGADEVDPDLDGNSYVLELLGDGTSPPITIKYDGLPNDKAQSAPVPSTGRARSNRRMEDENPPADTPWYESLPDMDEDYREFFRHIRMENGRMVLEIRGKVVYYELDEARSGGGSKAEGEEKGEEKKAPVAASGEEKVAVISLDGPVLSKSRVRDGRAHGQKVEEDQEGKYGVGKDEGKDGAVKDERKDVAGKDEEVSLDGPMEPEACDRHAEPAPGQKIKVGKKKEKLLNEPTMVNTVNGETNSSNVHDAEPYIASYERLLNNEAQSASVPSPGRARSNRRMEEENPPADTPWYESLPDMDEDYREFFRHIRMENDRMVLEIGDKVVYYELEEARSGGRSKAEEEEKKGEQKKAPVAALGEEKVVVISFDGPVLSKSRVRDVPAHGQKVEEDQEGKYGVGKDEGKDGAVKDEGKDVAGKDQEVGLDEPMVVVSKPEVCDRHAEPAPGQNIKVGKKKEKLLNEPTMVSTVNRETNTINGHDAKPYIASYEGLPNDEAQSASVPSPDRARSNRRMEEENPPADALWYESLLDMDEDYREFFRHIRMENDHMVLEIGGKIVYYELDEARSGGRSKTEREEKGEEKKAPVAASGEEKVAVISLDGPVLSKSRVRDGRAHEQKKVEEDQEGKYGVGKDEVQDGAVKDEGKDFAGKDEEVGLDGPMAVVSKPKVCDRHAELAPGQKIKVGKKKEKLLNKPTMVSNVNRETNSSNGHEPYIASRLHGLVWPTHIIERPRSGFKERLMHVLSKPFSQGEYEKLFHRATICKPARKERGARRCVKYYNCTHEKNKSYFDCYPDLAKQVEGASYPNRLALLRGLFFWLEDTVIFGPLLRHTAKTCLWGCLVGLWLSKKQLSAVDCGKAAALGKLL